MGLLVDSTVEERISKLSVYQYILDISIEYLNLKKQRELRWKKTEQNIQVLWDNHKRYNTCILGIREEEKEKEQKKYLKNND